MGAVGQPTVRTDYAHQGNRLHEYTKLQDGDTIEEGGYAYDEDGNPWAFERFVYAGGQTWNYVTYLDYDKMGRVWRKRESERPPGGDLTPVSAWEYRYGSGQQRYLTRQLDPETLDPIPGTDTWSDYLGESIYGDYTVDSGNVTMTQRYMPGAWQTDVLAGTTSFFHTNALGTTRVLSDSTGGAMTGTDRLYTSFGASVTAPANPLTRYGYAGAWGYQPLTPDAQSGGLMHVGARTYDSALGRFLQRDPIGINGGLNVYAYVKNSPLRFVDPSGLINDGFDSSVFGTEKAFLEATGGLGESFLDRLWDRMRGRTIPAGPASGAGAASNARRIKGEGGKLGPKAKGTTHAWAEMLRRAGWRRAAKFIRIGGPIAMACAGIIDMAILTREAPFAFYDIPAGHY